MRRWIAVVGLFGLIWSGCGEGAEPGPDDDSQNQQTTDERGTWSGGKSDEGATCADHCGDSVPTEAGCFCDESCVEFGDCCPDYETHCTEGPEEATCDLPCESMADCPANEPYCNYESGTCQQTPPECKDDSDCEDYSFCGPSGYCNPFPHMNCRAGWTVFEGDCDNPACVQEACPEGTEIDQDTCFCDPTGSAPSCDSQADCTDAFPYCNYETETCQQTPPECKDDSECEDYSFCGPSGYCNPFPHMNCRAGWTVFEGDCDNPSCVQETCPENSLLDEETCYCIPVCG